VQFGNNLNEFESTGERNLGLLKNNRSPYHLATNIESFSYEWEVVTYGTARAVRWPYRAIIVRHPSIVIGCEMISRAVIGWIQCIRFRTVTVTPYRRFPTHTKTTLSAVIHVDHTRIVLGWPHSYGVRYHEPLLTWKSRCATAEDYGMKAKHQSRRAEKDGVCHIVPQSFARQNHYIW